MRRALALIGALAVQATAVLAVAASAQAAPQHVGVVVRYSDGRVSAGCATAGGNGLQVLEQRHSVVMGTQQYSGFVLTIDGVGTSRPDNTHYWSYWHSAGRGGWSYASSGAGTYQPPAGSVEGWSYVNGQGSAPRPPSYTYSALCGNLDPKPAPTPTRAAKPTPRPTHSSVPQPHRVAPTPQPSSPAVRPAAAHSRAHHPPATRSARPSATHRRSAAPRSASSTAASTTSAAPRSSQRAAPPTAPPTASPSPVAQPVTDTGGFPAWGTLLALVVVAGLAATATVVMRRRSG